jgi:hypothetical protein
VVRTISCSTWPQDNAWLLPTVRPVKAVALASALFVAVLALPASAGASPAPQLPPYCLAAFDFSASYVISASSELPHPALSVTYIEKDYAQASLSVGEYLSYLNHSSLLPLTLSAEKLAPPGVATVLQSYYALISVASTDMRSAASLLVSSRGAAPAAKAVVAHIATLTMNAQTAIKAAGAIIAPRVNALGQIKGACTTPQFYSANITFFSVPSVSMGLTTLTLPQYQSNLNNEQAEFGSTNPTHPRIVATSFSASSTSSILASVAIDSPAYSDATSPTVPVALYEVCLTIPRANEPGTSYPLLVTCP